MATAGQSGLARAANTMARRPPQTTAHCGQRDPADNGRHGFLLAHLDLTSGAIDLTGPLTALLVMQASAFSTLKMGAIRVGAVLAGVLVATLVSIWIGLTWWSLGAVIAASLILARIFRLGEQAMEAPISAMLILGVTNPNVAAEISVEHLDRCRSRSRST